MTYGWMLLVVAVVGGAVFSMIGDQHIESVTGFDSGHITIQDFGVSKEDGLIFSIGDPVGQVSVAEIKVNDLDSGNITYLLNQDPDGEEIVNLPGIIPSDNGRELQIDINYDSGNLENITTSGRLAGELEIDDSFEERTLILNGLKGYWSTSKTYTEEDKVHDLTLNDNHGQLSNGNDFVEGHINEKSLRFHTRGFSGFEETNSFEISTIKPDSEYTVVTWMRWDGGEQTENPEGGSRFISPFGDPSTSGTIYFSSSSGTEGERFRYRLESGDDVRTAHDDMSWPNGNPFQLAWTIDDEVLRVYENSSFIGEESIEDYGERMPYRRFGHSGSGNSYYGWDGIIEEVYIYDRALSENEINFLYESTGVT